MSDLEEAKKVIIDFIDDIFKVYSLTGFIGADDEEYRELKRLLNYLI